MERLNRTIRVDTKITDKNKVNPFALQGVFKGLGVSYEYKIDAQWNVAKPSQKPEGTRVVFDDVEKFRAAKDVYFAWQDIMEMENSMLKPEKPDAALKRLLNARMGNSLTLFVPWGVRIEGTFRASEEFAMDRVAQLRNRLRQRKVNTNVLLMPADLYATEVNNQVGSEAALRYFGVVSNAAGERGFRVKPWSAIRSENLERYTDRAKQLTETGIRQLLPAKKISEAIAAAARRSGYTKQEEITQAAFSYLRERICEAEIIEQQYEPIKVSAVGINKDNYVDRELPRLYIIPDQYQFPWLK